MTILYEKYSINHFIQKWFNFIYQIINIKCVIIMTNETKVTKVSNFKLGFFKIVIYRSPGKTYDPFDLAFVLWIICDIELLNSIVQIIICQMVYFDCLVHLHSPKKLNLAKI